MAHISSLLETTPSSDTSMEGAASGIHDAATLSQTRAENALLRAEIEELKLQLPSSARSHHPKLHANRVQNRASYTSFKSGSKPSLTQCSSSSSSRARVEIEALKRELAAVEMASATRLRLQEIDQMLQKAQELDLAFLFDATGSMEVYIDIVKQRIAQIAQGILDAYPGSTLRVAYVYYRDYDDGDRYGSFDFTTSFNGLGSKFVEALAGVRAEGGDDEAKDVYSGLEELANLSWEAHNRVVYHIADAPCHGKRFHDFSDDDDENDDSYPEGDLNEREMETLLRKLREGCQISTYTFLHLTRRTHKMLQELKKIAALASDGDDWICEDEFEGQTLESIPPKVVASCTATLSHTISSYAKLTYGGPSLNIAGYRPRDIKTELPAWEEIAWQEGQVYKFKWYSELSKLLQDIQKGRPLQLEKTQSIQVRLGPYPFSKDGATRWPFYAQMMTGEYDIKLMVVKKFKDPVCGDTAHLHTKAEYIEQMEVQAVSAQLADDFNRYTRAIPQAKQVAFTRVSTLQMQSSTYYNMEKVLSGLWIKFNNNVGYASGKGSSYADTLQAFSHWTHERSRGMLMVTDLQGVQIPSIGADAFLLCDPVIHCQDVLRFTRTNLGQKGFELFFKSHNCNAVCHGLGLSLPTNSM